MNSKQVLRDSEINVFRLFHAVQKISSNLEDEVENLHRTDDREASEEAHGSSNG